MTNSVYFDPAVGGDGSTVTDDGNPTTGLSNSGHRVRFVPALSQLVAVADFTVTNSATQVAAATTQANNAAASAVTALNAPGTISTSTTSTAIPTTLPTTISVTTQTAKLWTVGQTLKLARTSAPENWILGTCTAYNSGTGALNLNATHVQGVGTYTDWTITLAAPILSTTVNAVQAKSANFTAYKADKGRVYHCTSTFTLTLDAVATLEADWYAYVKNTGSGVITIDPNAAETINGVSTLTVNAGEEYRIYTDSIAIYASKMAGDRSLRTGRTSNTILGLSDNGNFIDITSGTFTQTFTAAATLGNGWNVTLRNSGTGDITLDPNGAETIDALTTFIMYSGETRRIYCDGSNFFSVVLSGFTKTFTASGTFTKAPGYTSFDGLLWSGGQSGERTNSTGTLSRGGNGGGCFPFTLLASSVAATETVTIGAGGTVQTGVAVGNSGGNSSFGSFVTVVGATSTSSGAISGGGANAGGFQAISATPSAQDSLYSGSTASSNASTNSGSGVYGGAAGGGVDGSGNIRTPGTSNFGGAGGAASIASNGTAGTAPGGGGGATQTGTQSGAGARGELRISGRV